MLNGSSIGKGETPPQELFAVIKKRIERTLIRTVRTTFVFRFDFLFNWFYFLDGDPSAFWLLSLYKEGGSYQQRVLSEYLNGIQSRAEQIVQVLEG